MYDVIVVGGGPAGLTSANYCLRAGKKVLLIERLVLGGQVAFTPVVKNYPAFAKISGVDLAENFANQVKENNCEIVYSDVISYDLLGDIKQVETNQGTFLGKTIILCLGVSLKEQQIENEKEFLGKGVSYCATCDGNFFKGKTVVVSATENGLEDITYLSNLARKVIVVSRKNDFCGESQASKEIQKLENVEIISNSEILCLNGNEKLESVVIKNLKNNLSQTILADGMFILVGKKPDTNLIKNIINTDKDGYIITDENMQTNIKGVFAAGDVRKKSLKQIVTACSDGAIASVAVNEYLSRR